MIAIGRQQQWLRRSAPLLLEISVTRFGKVSPLYRNIKKFGHFERVELVFGKVWPILYAIGPILYAIGPIRTVENGNILKNNLAIWSHSLEMIWVKFIWKLNLAEREWKIILWLCQHFRQPLFLPWGGEGPWSEIIPGKSFKIIWPWWWSSGQRTCLALWRYEFVSRWNLQFYSVNYLLKNNKNLQKEAMEANI